jgi:hypothetical protein
MKNVEFDEESKSSFVPKGEEQKLIKHLYNDANISITPDIIQKNNSIKELIEYCAYAKSLLTLRYERRKTQMYYKSNLKLRKIATDEYEYILNYIGYVPTDHYRSKYPSPIVIAFK